MTTNSPVATVFDVAAYILRKLGPVSAMKLQKLVYYCQAWSLVWDERPLFGERIEAWASGPVVPDLFACHKGQFIVSDIPAGDPERLDQDAKDTIDAVIQFYGNRTPQWLSDLTHREEPWKNARQEIPEGARSNAVITLDSMAEYYGSLAANDEEEAE
jgi:uncharacterized phage-associated protein